MAICWPSRICSQTLRCSAVAFAEHEGARDVGLVALRRRSRSPCSTDFALAHGLGFARAVWIGAGLAEQDQRRIPREAPQGRMRGGDHRADVAAGVMPALDVVATTMAVRGDGDVVGLLHERELGRGLHHAAAADHAARHS